MVLLTYSSHFSVVSSFIVFTVSIVSDLISWFWKQNCNFSSKWLVISSADVFEISNPLFVSEHPSNNTDTSSAFRWTRCIWVSCSVTHLNWLKSCHSSFPICTEGSAITAARQGICYGKTRTRPLWNLVLWILISKCWQWNVQKHDSYFNIHEIAFTTIQRQSCLHVPFSQSVRSIEWTYRYVININNSWIFPFSNLKYRRSLVKRWYINVFE